MLTGFQKSVVQRISITSETLRQKAVIRRSRLPRVITPRDSGATPRQEVRRMRLEWARGRKSLGCATHLPFHFLTDQSPELWRRLPYFFDFEWSEKQKSQVQLQEWQMRQ